MVLLQHPGDNMLFGSCGFLGSASGAAVQALREDPVTQPLLAQLLPLLLPLNPNCFPCFPLVCLLFPLPLALVQPVHFFPKADSVQMFLSF